FFRSCLSPIHSFTERCLKPLDMRTRSEDDSTIGIKRRRLLTSSSVRWFRRFVEESVIQSWLWRRWPEIPPRLGISITLNNITNSHSKETMVTGRFNRSSQNFIGTNAGKWL